jgi:hypothetical protein
MIPHEHTMQAATLIVGLVIAIGAALALGAWQDNESPSTQRLEATSVSRQATSAAVAAALAKQQAPAPPLVVLIVGSLEEGEAAQLRYAETMPGWQLALLVVNGRDAASEADYAIAALQRSYARGTLTNLRIYDLRQSNR